MEILQIYEKAKEELDKVLEASIQSENHISSITLIFSENDICYTGINWSRINNSFQIEQTCSEYEALKNLLFDGYTAVKTLITLDISTKLAIPPCAACQNLIVKLNPANISCSVITGEDSSNLLSELNPELVSLVSTSETIEETNENNDSEATADTLQEVSTDETKPDNNETVNEEQTTKQSSIDTSELKMIFDDWESTDEQQNEINDSIQNKPYNINSLSLESASETEENPNSTETLSHSFPQMPSQQNTMYQQQDDTTMYQQQQAMNNGMFQQQPMNNSMFQQQQPMNNGMFQQQPMNNGMFQQQPMNGMFQQPINVMQQQPMNAMQQQPMNAMQQQPMNAMQQQQTTMGMFQQQPVHMTQNANNTYMTPQQPQNNFQNNIPQTSPQTNANITPIIPQNTYAQSPINTAPSTIKPSSSVYGANINTSDNNAIFKDRLNNLLNTRSSTVTQEEEMNDLLQSAKDKKKAEKQKAKLRKQKNE